MTQRVLAPCLPVSSSRMRPGPDLKLQPELLPIRIHSLATHRLSNLSFWSPTREQFSLGARTLKAIFRSKQHHVVVGQSLSTNAPTSWTHSHPHHLWLSITAK